MVITYVFWGDGSVCLKWDQLEYVTQKILFTLPSPTCGLTNSNFLCVYSKGSTCWRIQVSKRVSWSDA